MEKWGKVVTKVRELCARDIGVSLAELRDEINRPLNCCSGYLSKMLAEKEVYKAGSHGYYRYFKSKEHAEAHDAVAKIERAARLAESTKRKNDKRAAKEREKRAAARAAKGLPPYVKPTKKEKPPKSPRISLEKRYSGLVLSKKEEPRPAARIVWPDHVKIQKIGHGEDTRFKFTPPSGWKGEITKDWEARVRGY